MIAKARFPANRSHLGWLTAANTTSIWTILIWTSLLLTSCSQPDGEAIQPNEATPQVNGLFLLTQEVLDAVQTVVSASDTAITGDAFRVRNDGSANDLKDIFTNKPLDRALRVGDIFVVRAFRNIDGRKGQLNFIDIMVRREAGFNPNGADFEYFRMDFDPNTDYQRNPNGLVPTLTNTRDRGIDVARANCVGCHRFAPGGDFLFTVR